MAYNDLKVRITGDGSQFKAAIAGATRDIETFGKSGAGAIAAVTRVLGPLGAALSAAGFVQLTKSVIDNADQMGKFAQKSGIAVETLSALDYAAKASDVSTGELATSIKFLNKSLIESQDSSSQTAKLFTAMGVSAVDGAGNLRSADAVLLDLAETFKALPDGAEKSGLALKLFGKSGESMIPFLNEGRAGITALTAEAERLGVVVGADMAKAADEFNDNFDRLKSSLFGFANTVLPPVIDGMNKLNELFGVTGSKPLPSASDWAADMIKDRQNAIADLNDELDRFVRGSQDIMQLPLTALTGRNADDVRRDITEHQNAILEYAKLREGAMKFEEKAAKDVKAPSAAAVGKVLSGSKTGGSGKTEAVRNTGAELAEDVIRATYTETETLSDELIRLNALWNVNLISTDAYAVSIGNANAKTQHLNETNEEYGKSMFELARIAYPAATETAEEYGERMKELAEAQLAAAKNGDEVAQIYKDTASSIRGAFRETFRDIFDNGVDGFKNFGDRLLNIFKDLLADMATMAIARPIIIPMTSAIGGMLGVSGDAQASVAQQLGGSAMSGATGSNMMGMALAGMGTFGTGVMAGMSGGFGAVGALSGTTTAMTTAGAALGAAIPWIAGAMLLDAVTGGGLFGTKWKTDNAGVKLSVSGGDVGGTQFTEQSKKKALFGGTKRRTKETALDDDLLDQLNATLDSATMLLVNGAKGFGVTTAQSILDGFSTSAKLSLKGKSKEEMQKAIDDWMGETIASMGVAVLNNTEWSGLFATVVTESKFIYDDLGMSFQKTTKLVRQSTQEMVQALFTIGGYLSANPLADATEIMRLAGRTLRQQYDDQTEAMFSLAASFDGSEESAVALAAATQERYKSEIQMLQQIASVAMSVTGTLDDSIRSITESVMQPGELYASIGGRVDQNMALLSGAVSPEDVERLVESITADTNQLWGMLPQGQRQTQAQEFVTFLTGVKELSTSRLDTIQEDVKASHDSIAEVIKFSLESVAQRMEAAAQAQVAAANKLEAAAEAQRLATAENLRMMYRSN